jgi:hypothetical protein
VLQHAGVWPSAPGSVVTGGARSARYGDEDSRAAIASPLGRTSSGAGGSSRRYALPSRRAGALPHSASRSAARRSIGRVSPSASRTSCATYAPTATSARVAVRPLRLLSLPRALALRRPRPGPAPSHAGPPRRCRRFLGLPSPFMAAPFLLRPNDHSRWEPPPRPGRRT